jgi:ATP-binding cassette, subfamily B, bacterial
MSSSKRSRLTGVASSGAFGRLLLLIWHARPVHVTLLLSLLCMEGLLPPAGLVLARHIIDTIIANMNTEPVRSLASDPVLQQLLFGGMVLAAAIVLLDIFTTILQQLVEEVVIPEMNVRLVEKAARVPYTFYEEPAFYDTLHQAEREIGTRPIQVLQQIPSLIQGTTTLIGFMVLLIGLQPQLAILLLLTGLPALYLQRQFSGRMFRQWKRHTPLMRWVVYYRGLLTSASSSAEVRLFRLADELVGRLKAAFTQIQRANIHLLRRYTLAGGVLQLFSIALYWGAFAWVVDQALRGSLSVGDVVLFSSIVLQMRVTIHNLTRSFGMLMESSLFLSNYFAFLDLDVDMTHTNALRPVPMPITQGFQLENVSFTYPGSVHPALQDINLSLRPNERVAIVGTNGAGKSTLVKLLARLYEPSSGYIRLDGIDLREYDLNNYHCNFSMIAQNFVQYHLSVSDNIGFGAVELLQDLEAVEQAARLSGAEEFIHDLPQRYNTLLGRFFEGSTQLSGGQWQKLALARTYLPSAQILVLDEPSASLDIESEAKMVKTYAHLTIGQIAILISHRFSTVRLADRIIVLHEGRLVEDGTHDALMQAGGLYAAMFRTQAQAYTPEA